MQNHRIVIEIKEYLSKTSILTVYKCFIRLYINYDDIIYSFSCLFIRLFTYLFLF